jgi:hypothetical protein
MPSAGCGESVSGFAEIVAVSQPGHQNGEPPLSDVQPMVGAEGPGGGSDASRKELDEAGRRAAAAHRAGTAGISRDAPSCGRVCSVVIAKRR